MTDNPLPKMRPIYTETQTVANSAPQATRPSKRSKRRANKRANVPAAITPAYSYPTKGGQK
jgi:hypothetical protein